MRQKKNKRDAQEHQTRLRETTEEGRYDAPPAFCLDRGVIRDVAGIDPNSPLLSLDGDVHEAMVTTSNHRSIRSSEARLAAELITSWLNGERIGSASVPGSAEYGDWRNTTASRLRVLLLIDRARSAVKRAQEYRKHEYDQERHIPITPLLYPESTRPYATHPFPVMDLRTGRIGLRHTPTSRRYPMGEVLAAHGVLTLLQCDALELLRRCANEHCGRWFFAKRSLSRACKPACKQRLYDTQEEVKEKRRKARPNNAAYKRRIKTGAPRQRTRKGR